MDFYEIIDAEIKNQGTNAADVSMRAVGNKWLVYSLKKGHPPNAENLKKLCAVLGLEFYVGPPRTASTMPSADASGPGGFNSDFDPDAMASSTLMLDHYGDIAAGGSDHPNDGRIWFAGTPGETVTPPPGFTDPELMRHGGLVALTVRGRSMDPVYRDGDTVYIYRDDPVQHDMEKLIGLDCAVTLTGEHDHAVYLKRMRRPDNGEAGFFNLESLNGDWKTLVDMPITAALPIRHVRRRV